MLSSRVSGFGPVYFAAQAWMNRGVADSGFTKERRGMQTAGALNVAFTNRGKEDGEKAR